MKLFINILLIFILATCSTVKKQQFGAIEGKDHFKKPINIDVSKKKITVVVFLSSVCPCSGSHIELLRKMNKEYKDVQFVAVHSNFYEDLNKAQYYFAKSKLGFPIILDGSTKLAKSFGAISTPHVFVLNQKGKIQYSGAVTSSNNALKAEENYLAATINNIKAGQKVSKKFRKPFGCKIVTK